MMRDTEPETIINQNEVEAVVSDLKLELVGRDNQISGLQQQIQTLTSKLEDIKKDLTHKENGIAQLKSQLEYQCLGRMFELLSLLITYLGLPQNMNLTMVI